MEGVFAPNLKQLPLLATVLSRLRRTSLLLFTKQLLQCLSTKYLIYSIRQEGQRWWDADRSRVGAVARILYDLYSHDKLSEFLVDTIKSANLNSLPLQRGVTLTISKLSSANLSSVTEYLVSSWADKVYILHTPIVAQEGPSTLYQADNSPNATSPTMSRSHFDFSSQRNPIIADIQ